MPNCKERDWNKPLRWRTRQMAFELPQRGREIQRSAFNTGKWSLLLFTWLPTRFMMLMGLLLPRKCILWHLIITLFWRNYQYKRRKIWNCFLSSVNLFGVKEALFGHESIRMLCVELVPDLLDLLLRHLVLPHHYPHLQKIQHYHIIVVINIFVIFQAPLLWAEAQKPSWHYHLEGFCASRKFLRVTLQIALGSFHIVWKVSKLSGKFLDGLSIFWMVRKFPG